MQQHGWLSHSKDYTLYDSIYKHSGKGKTIATKNRLVILQRLQMGEGYDYKGQHKAIWGRDRTVLDPDCGGGYIIYTGVKSHRL